MKGILVPRGRGPLGIFYGVRVGSQTYPIHRGEVDRRGLRHFGEVVFMTRREGGNVDVIAPHPIVGCERRRG